MNKTINVKVTHQGKTALLQCPRNHILSEASEVFKKNLHGADIYHVEKNTKRKLNNLGAIRDLSNVEIVIPGETQRDILSYYGGESSKEESFVEKIMTKLRNNTTLTGNDRKYLIGVMENFSSENTLGKRKHGEDVNGYIKPTRHKKVQARPLPEFYKESFTQTDFELETVKRNVTRMEDPISSMKKIASDDSPRQKKIGSALMEETYSKRRHFIFVESPLVALIKEKYPLLFSADEIKNELDRTFYVGTCDDFLEQIDKYSNAILTLCDPSNPIYQRTIKSIECCHTEQQKKYAEAVGSILVLPSLVDEPIDFVYTVDNSKENAIYPYIDAHLNSLKALFFDNMLFKIMTEKQLVCEANNFKEAVLCLVACYFIFNINYMESCEDTLVVFEKLYLRANHTSDISSKAASVIKMVRMKANL